jgi:hypothetical protein
MAEPPVVVFRSVFRGRITFAAGAWVLEETPRHVVLAIVPGAESAQMQGPREATVSRLASGTEDLQVMPWHSQRHVWLMPFGAAHAIGHFWNDATGRFLCHYVNLQAPLRRSPIGFDSCDQVLDVVVDPDGRWHWKDEDEFEEALEAGLFHPAEAAAIRAEGERVIAQLPHLLPTGLEPWQPDPSWPLPKLPPNWRDL